jgi:hypothetical protein
VIKRQFGYTKVRYRGLKKNTLQLKTLFALSNLWMAPPIAGGAGMSAPETGAGRSGANGRKGVKSGAKTREKRLQLRHLKKRPVALTNPSCSGHPRWSN